MLKVLIAEVDLMAADLIGETLAQSGYEVCDIARTVAEAVALGRYHKPDLAVIDLRLAEGGLGTDIVAQLGGCSGLGVLYASGNISQLLATTVMGHACLAKPSTAIPIFSAVLKIVTQMVASGTAPPPFPRGFQVLPSEITAAA